MVNPPKGTIMASIQPVINIWPVIIIAKPKTNNVKGNNLRCVRTYDKLMDDTPITKANMIMPHSTHGLAKNPSPTNGRLVNTKGTMAQWMAHKVEAVMPMLSNRAVSLGNSMPQI